MPTDKLIKRSTLAAAAFLIPGMALAASDPTGVWINDTGRGAIEIKPCGDALCGHVVWVKDSSDTNGCGKQIIGEASKVGTTLWDNGWIYSPERKKRYDVELKPLENGNLRVTGYAGTKLFSKTMIWTPAPADLVRCDQTAPAVIETKTAPAPARAPSPPAEVEAKAQPAPTGTQTAAKVSPPPAPPAVAEINNDDAAPAAPSPPAADVPAADKPEPMRPANVKTADNSEDEDPIDLGKLKLGKIFRHTGSGNCKLDLPWVKITVPCKD